MGPSQSRLAYLFRQYADNNHTENERQEFINLLTIDEHANEIKSLIEKEIEGSTITERISTERADAIYSKILAARPVETPVKRLFTFSKVAAAAIIVLMLSLAGYFYFNKGEKQIARTTKNLGNDVPPGGNKAILTLADGTRIVLDSANNGTLTRQGNTKIIKLNNGELSYTSLNDPSTSPRTTEVVYNTITTPRGGQYQVTLPDGTKVWLNAESSLRFPTSFAGNERTVELSGEGYFEVTHNAKAIFHVKVNNINVQVLGTHFNINSYGNEPIVRTTLLEGSVKISSGSNTAILRPGQQAGLNSNNDIAIINNADVDEAVAWKNGRFKFNSADIKSIMRQASRWYNVEVVYEREINETFSGSISRNANISQLLKIIEATDKVSFKIDGRKIMVKKK